MTPRILIIDDDELMLASFRRWLRREMQCEVHCATDREEAEALLDCHEYALVVTDLSLTPHRLEGLDLVERMTNAPQRPKLIALTGNGSEQVKSTVLRKGVDAFIEKPTPIQEILRIARKLIDSSPGAPATAPGFQSTGRLLAQLLDSATLQPMVQPIFQLKPPGPPLLVGVECLTRGPAGTPFERADALFAYARHKRAEGLLDQKCIGLALAQLGLLAEGVRISLNVHASTLGSSANFAGWLRSTAAAYAIRPERMTIEIVEHAPQWNQKEFLRSLDDLRDAGIKIALDDIGLGHSNYQMIVDVRPDYFKIDRYFVHGCSANRYRRAVVASITTLANELNGVVVAEGAEAESDFEVLRMLGVELVQSFALGRPVPARAFAEKHGLPLAG